MKLVKVLCIVLCLVILGAPILAKAPVFAQYTPGAQIYFDVQVAAISPLTDSNASIYGLETPGGSSTPVGQYFNVTIWLHNATLTNAPNGIQGIEVHLNITAFAFASGGNRVCQPVAFWDGTGQPGGVLIKNATNAPVYALNAGYYDKNGYSCPAAYAAEYAVATASTMGPWNASLGLVAWIQFEIMGAPSSSIAQPAFYAPIAISSADLETVIKMPWGYITVEVPFDIKSRGYYSTLHMDTVNYTFDSSVLAMTVIKYSFGLGYAGNISATVKNFAGVTAVFNAQFVANITVIGNTLVTLAAGAQVNVTIVGDSNKVGVYSLNNISIWTETVLGESNTANNQMTLPNSNFTLKGSYLCVTIQGDMNADKKTSLSDLSLLAKSYNKSVGNPLYNPNCDIKNTGTVALACLSILASHYNQGPWS
jgi:hypothetical protein